MNTSENEIKRLNDQNTGPKNLEKQAKRVSGSVRIVVGVVVLLVVIYNIGSILWFNSDIRELNNIGFQEVQIEKECKRRDDMIPNLITIARDYASHERALFQYVSDARSQIGPAASMREGAPALNSGELLSKLIALSEQYPDLKATKSFQDLMEMMETTEDRIASMRDDYIASVKEYNMCNQQFWCPFFTYFVNFVYPLPGFVRYYYTDADNKEAPLLKEEEKLFKKETTEESK